MRKPVVRIGLVGCGRIAEHGYIPALAEARRVSLAAVADPARDRCARSAPGVPAFSTAEELVDARLVDALVLATPAHAHLAGARAAAHGRLPALIEKPPAATLPEARALATLDPPPRLAFNRRFEPPLARLRAALPEGGALDFELEVRSRRGSWRPYESDDDPLLNLGPHLVDLMRWLSGAEAVRVRADVTSRRAAVEVELTGGRSRARLRCVADRPYRERIVVRAGTRTLGSYAAGGPAAAVRAILAGRRSNHALVPSFVRQLEAFARVVRGEPEETLAGVADGIAVMAVLDAARASSVAGGRWRTVEGLSDEK